MEARPLLRMDESRYHRLRLDAAQDDHPALTGELQRELALIHAGQISVLASHATRGTRIWGVFDDFHLAGAIALSPLYADTDHLPLWLWGLYVQPRFRGTPASRLLMRAVQAWAEAHHPGGPILAAYHRQNRRASQLLERFGFIDSELHATLQRAGLAGSEDQVVEYARHALPPRAAIASP